MNPKDRTGSPAVALLRRSDGKLLWTFEVPGAALTAVGGGTGDRFSERVHFK